MNHLLSIEDLDRAAIERIVAQAERFAEVSDREIKKVPALRGRMVLNLFYEASTRTRSSFELAAKRLSADVVNFAASGSSVEKGESLKDTVLTLSAHKPDAIVLRTPWAGAAELVSRWCTAAIVNAGDGKHEHPTQALLDVYTLHRRLGRIDGAEIWIVGDVAHSRVARSNILAFQRMGAKVTVAGPPTLIPRGIEQLGCEVRYTLDELHRADVVYALRMQHERMSETWVPSLREYAAWYQINGRRLTPRQMLMHPGPVNRGVELSGEVVDSPAGGDHRAGRGGRRRADGGALRAAGRLGGAHARQRRSPARRPPSRSGREDRDHERSRAARRRGRRPRRTCCCATCACSTRARGSTPAATSACATAASPSSPSRARSSRAEGQETIDGGGRLVACRPSSTRTCTCARPARSTRRTSRRARARPPPAATRA